MRRFFCTSKKGKKEIVINGIDEGLPSKEGSFRSEEDKVQELVRMAKLLFSCLCLLLHFGQNMGIQGPAQTCLYPYMTFVLAK